MSEPIDLDALARTFGELRAVKYNCDCQVGGVDATSVDADWLHLIGKRGLALLAEVERLTRIIDGYDRTPAEQRAAEAEAEVERLGVLVQSERDAYADLQHEFEVHFGWTVPEGKVCHACHELEVEENSRLLNEAWEDVERLRAENERLREREARRHSKFSQVQPRVSMLEMLGCADDEPATLVLSPEIWCDVCGAWHIPTSCSTANGAGEARTDPRAANRPGMALGDTPQAEDAGEVQS